MWLVDQDRSYRVISDTTVPNYGRLGGTLRVILVERAGSENPERMSVEHFQRCSVVEAQA